MAQPKVRLKGFSGDWENKSFSEIFSFLAHNSLSRAELCDKSENAANVHYGDVLIKYGEILDCSKDGLTYIINTNLSEHLVKKGSLSNGDVIFADAAEDEAVGKCSEIQSVADLQVVSGLHTVPCHPEIKFASYYLGYYLNSRSYHNQLLPLMQGTKVFSLSKGAFEQTKISYPSNLSEQRAIASYLRSLDSLITSTLGKVNSLKQMKAACLQNMFPQKGEKTPKVRFKGFCGEWEEKKFGDIIKLRRGLTYSPIAIRKNGIRVLRSSNIEEDVFVIKEDDVFVDQSAINIDFTQNNDILITAANGSSRLVGKHALISDIANKTTVHGGFMLLGTPQMPYFTNALMSSAWYSHFISQYVAGGNGAIGNLNKADLEQQLVLIPNMNEQQKIGEFFRSLDSQIYLQKQRLEKLKQLKAACFHQMFV